MRVIRVNPVAEKVIDERLCERTHLHVCVHIQILDCETIGTQHLAGRYHVRMHFSPRERLDGNIQIVRPGARHFKHRRRRESRATMSVILNDYVWICLLYLTSKFREESRPSDSGHVLEANLIGPIFHDLADNVHVVFNGVDRRMGDAQGYLRNHSGLLGIFDAEPEVAVVV